MENQYAVPSTFLVGVAEEARRLTNTADPLTTDGMLAALEGVELGGDYEDANEIYY